MAIGIKDLALCLASTYFATQSALLYQGKILKVKSESSAMHSRLTKNIIYITAYL
jgi:hypothetical protein